MMRRRKFAQVLVAGTVAPTLFAWREPVAVAAGISKSWDLCAASATIVVGTLHVPVEELQAARSGKRRYLRPNLDVAETLKGERSDAVVITFYSEDRPYAPQSATLLALDGQQVVAFLESAKDPENEKPANYFAGSTPDALRAASSAGVADLRAEVARQDRVLRTWRPHPDWPHWAEVKRLIGKTLQEETATQAFEKLEKLGSNAVPAMVDLMDDRRPVGAREIVLQNPPGFWEGTRHYGPQLVVDALAAILNQVTGRDFGSIYNGATEQQRRRAVNGWRIYADIQRNHPSALRTSSNPRASGLRSGRGRHHGHVVLPSRCCRGEIGRTFVAVLSN